ncbi:MAG: PmoA family protein, partial [Chthoniobacterales bacterium]|nr:PmoA family protein [Chthoniobacterales bacterium]
MSAVPLLCLTPGTARAEFTFADTAGDHLDVLQNGKPLLRWQYAFDASTPERLHDTYKPYLHVMDAAGKEPITTGPGGEFTHHRGWFLGWS